MNNHLIYKFFFGLSIILIAGSCAVKYSFTGASISPESKTVSVKYFNNISAIIYPSLSQTLTEALKDRFVSQTSLVVVQGNGDLNFEGQITNYTITPVAIQGNQYALQNRLTITVQVKFTNKNNPELNYTKSFSEYEDFSSTQTLVQVESDLTKLIVDKLVDGIFNQAVANW
jgi:hypothetical protein